MDRFVTISGCSGGGKSALLAELQLRGHVIVEEPGRRIIAEELAGAGSALPWVNLEAFARRAIEIAVQDRLSAANLVGPVFFDRGLIDAVAALEHATGKKFFSNFRSERYNRAVFLAPPWQEIYRQDDVRRHTFGEAVEEYARLEGAFRELDYDIVLLPKVSVAERGNIVLERLGL